MKKHMISLLALATFSGGLAAQNSFAADIPRPADVEVTRDNYQRIVNVLHNAGLNRAEIKRWIQASINAHDGPDFGNIPNPNRIKVTRKNYKRVVSALHGLGLNRQQIKRWINASLDAHSGGGDRPAVTARDVGRATDRAVERVRDRSPDRQIVRTTDRARTIGRVADKVATGPRSRPARVDRVRRPVRSVRIQRVNRPPTPVRPARPSRTRG